MSDSKQDKLFSGVCDFISAASDPAHFPPGKLPEIAFWGRSNAGKSSLVNALTNRKSLARTSKTPGRTQQIVFFNLGNRMMLADMPGYGHAKAPKAQIEQWNSLIDYYLKTRPQLKCVCLLIDGRHGLMTNDLEMMKKLDRAAAGYQIVLTKADLVPAQALAERIKQTKLKLQTHAAARPDILVVSAEKNEGVEELRHFLTGFADKKPS